MTIRRALSRSLVCSVVCSLASLALAQQVQPPGDYLGHPVGADFELPDWAQVSGYYRQLAQQSPRVKVEKVGTTTEGRDFLLATISSPENLAKLEQIRANSRRIADPRGLDAAARTKLIEETPLTLFVSCAMHSTETAGSQFGMEFSYLLATSDQEPWVSARQQVVVVLAPNLNPDGLDVVAHWYRDTKRSPYEGSGLLRLYQLYAGHDNNRDWFGLTQNETRIVTSQLYSRWFPQVYWDVHQQGQGRERLFVPPYRDPLNPNLDPAIIAAIDALGSRALLDLTREGKTGVSTGVTYDMWWNGGNRNVPVRHNIVGLLTEAASVNIASPIFLAPGELSAPRGLGGYAPSNRFPAPWPGGWWRMRDIIDYEMAFGRSLLGSLSRERQSWQRNAMEASQRAIDAGRQDSPVGWVIPADNPDRGAVRRLVDGLLLGGVEVYRATGAVQADGREWPAGSLVIPRDQPYGSHVKDLFEVQRYPEGDPPYDVAGWTLPLLLGVHRVEVVTKLEAEKVRITAPAQALQGFSTPAPGELKAGWSTRDSDTWVELFQRLDSKQSVYMITAGERGGTLVPTGTSDAAGVTMKRLPRIGIYSPWAGSMDEGWLRWVFDSRQIPYVRVRNEQIRAGDLGDLIDVLLIADIGARTLDRGRRLGSVPARYARGLSPEGAVAVEEFVRQGGLLITMSASARWAIDLFQLPLEDVTRPRKRPDGFEFSCPGSVLRTIPVEHALTAGLPPSMAVFFSRSSAFELTDEQKSKSSDDGPAVEVLLNYAPTRILLSGWIKGEDRIAGQGAWVRARHGEGHVHLFGFRPQYRGWSQQAFQLLYRAVLDDPSR